MKYLSVMPQEALSVTKPLTWERIVAANKRANPLLISEDGWTYDGIVVDGVSGEGLVVQYPMNTEDKVSVLTAHEPLSGEIGERAHYWWAQIFMVPDWITEEGAIEWITDSYGELDIDTEKTVLFELNGVPLGVMDPVEVDMTEVINEWMADQCPNPGGPRASEMGWEK